MKLQHLLLRSTFYGTVLSVGVVHAQSSVTLYGIIDTGIEYVSHANTSGSSVIRIPSITGELPSRWGLRGIEDLGDGLSVQFVLESGFNVDNGSMGSQGGRLFGRQAWVGIHSNYGLLSFGRQYTMSYWATGDADILGPTIYGMASLDPYLAGRRSDNTVAYLTTFYGLTVGATYSFGRDSTGTGNSPGQGTCAGPVPGNPAQCRQWTAMLKYDAAWYGAAVAYDEQRGGANADADLYNGTVPFPLTNSADKDARTVLNGYVHLGDFKVGSGYMGRMVTTITGTDVHSNIFYTGVLWQATPAFTLDGEVYRVINAAQDTRASMVTLRGTYLLSKRTAVYLQSGYLANSAKAQYTVSSGGGGTTPAKGDDQIGVMVGITHSF
jgi:predicted porin